MSTSPWIIPSCLPRLRADDVHVWQAHVHEWSSHEAAFRATLSLAESDRADRFHFDRDRRQFVTCRGLLRQLLACYTGLDAVDLEFVTGSAGKPFLAVGRTFEFNVSHADDVMLLAVTPVHPVGVDVERVREDLEFDDMIRHFFAPAECCSYAALERERRVAGFFACWTRKEAYIKATGLGVSRGLDYFEVTVDPDQAPALVVDRLDPARTSALRITDLPMTGPYAAALVIDQRVTTHHCFMMKPTVEWLQRARA